MDDTPAPALSMQPARGFHRAAVMCAAAYRGDMSPRWEAPGLCRAFSFIEPDGSWWCVFEGTRPGSLADLARDAGAAFSDRADPAIGDVDASFYEDVLAVLFRILRDVPIDIPLCFAGHSKGASEALIAAALWKLAGRPLGQVCAFEPARVGNLGGLLASAQGVLTWAKRNPLVFDPVPLVPSWREHPMPVTVVTVDAPDPLGCHSIEKIVAALT